MMANSAAKMAPNVKMIAAAGEEKVRFHPNIENNGGVRYLITCSDPQSHRVLCPIFGSKGKKLRICASIILNQIMTMALHTTMIGPILGIRPNKMATRSLPTRNNKA